MKRRIPLPLLLFACCLAMAAGFAAGDRIVYPQAAVGPIQGQEFDIELTMGNLDPNGSWLGTARLLKQEDLTGMTLLAVEGPSGSVSPTGGAWDIEIPASGSIRFQISSSTLQVGVLVIEPAGSSRLEDLVPSFFYRLKQGGEATDLIAVQPEREPAVAYNTMISRRSGFGVGVAIVSDDALSDPAAVPLPVTEVTFTVTLPSGESRSAVVLIGGSEAAQKAVFTNQVIAGLPDTFDSAQLSLAASRPIFVTLLGVGTPPLFRGVQIGAAPAQRQSNSRFGLRPGWTFLENGEDLMTNGFWPCAGSAIKGCDGGFIASAGSGFETTINQVGPKLQVTGDFSVHAAVHASSFYEGSMMIVGRRATGPEWWRGQRRLDIGVSDGQVFTQSWNNSPSPVIQHFLQKGALGGMTRLEVARSGASIQIYVDGALAGTVPDFGLFEDGTVYLGTNVGPGNEFTVYGLAASIPAGGPQNAAVVLPAIGAQVPGIANSLRELADARSLRFGAAVEAGYISDEAAYREILGGHFNMLTPENVTKWGHIHPERDRYSFCRADMLATFAEANGMDMRGHTLVWHNQNPAWLESGNFSREELIQILRDHIFTVAGRYRDQIDEWDVVNEAFEWDGSLRQTVWLNGIGPDYIEMAFEWARQAAPKAKLYYNDYSIATRNAKSDAIFNHLVALRQKGVPVDGIGFQAHVGIEPGLRPGKSDVVSNIKRFNDAGMSVIFTEVDVRLRLPADQSKLNQQAAVYRDLLEACLEAAHCPTFVMWGFTDKHSWIPSVFTGYGAALPWDEAYQPKPAFDALKSALSQ